MHDRRAAGRFWKNPRVIVARRYSGRDPAGCDHRPDVLPGHATGNRVPSPSLPLAFNILLELTLTGVISFIVCLTGGRISMLVGLCGALVSLVIGTAYGLVAGYSGGKIDDLMMRIVDILYSIPRLIFILICINAFNSQLQEFASRMGWDWLVFSSRIAILIVSLGIIEWLTLSRIVRGQTLALKSRAFVAAAAALGQSHHKILLKHVLPNLLGVILIYLTLTIPAVIIDESFLSFLGLGVQAPAASWGSLLADGAASLNPIFIRWWVVVFPAAAMAITLLALNFLGDALRDALDPHRIE